MPGPEGLHHKLWKNAFENGFSSLALGIPLKHGQAALDQFPDGSTVALKPQMPRCFFEKALLGGLVKISLNSIAECQRKLADRRVQHEHDAKIIPLLNLRRVKRTLVQQPKTEFSNL